MILLEVNHLGYSYQDGENQRIILRDINCSFEAGTFTTILGESGSGKTTFLSLLGALDQPKEGTICFQGLTLQEIGEDHFRKNYVGFVFQNYNLIPYMNAIENVLLAMGITDNVYSGDKTEKAIAILADFGITGNKAKRKVTHLSGGEQQRVAIARAVSTQVQILLADEPTGNLDQETSDYIAQCFKTLAHDMGKCVIVVTHDPRVAELSDQVFRLDSRTHSLSTVEVLL